MDEGALRQYIAKVIDVDNEVYSTRMASVFCMVLSALLWWIPLLGPAVAGYVCGRKAGSMVKGMFCALVSGAVILLAVKGMSALVLGHGGYPDIPADEAAAALSGVVGKTADYLQMFFTEGTASLNFTSLGILMVFGGVGGILSRQARKETAFLIRLGATEGSPRPTARSAELYRMDKDMGFKSFDDCIATQRMTTNENRDTGADRSGRKEEMPKTQERKPVVTTVQTVTSTVSGTASAAKNKEEGNPFTDILERSDRKAP
ncbi:MAG: hypothetical protein LBB30_04265 [Candidatus Methanoplasma sp.]|jgi:hypothetical protein|nr:hypothetical protein [Candidatus Methanoplasma sp.]